jgi:hypothetical protein
MPKIQNAEISYHHENTTSVQKSNIIVMNLHNVERPESQSVEKSIHQNDKASNCQNDEKSNRENDKALLNRNVRTAYLYLGFKMSKTKREEQEEEERKMKRRPSVATCT